jgi:hypothetical protein
MPKKKKVFVVRRNDEFFVIPPVIDLEFKGGNGDELKLQNKTDEDLLWVVSDAIAFGNAVQEIVAAKGTSTAKTAQNVSDLFEYQVLMLKSGKKAKGNSDPVIIIEN